MTLLSLIFMTENLTPDYFKSDEYNHNIENNDYKNLITRLKEIKTTINLLEKITFK